MKKKLMSVLLTIICLTLTSWASENENTNQLLERSDFEVMQNGSVIVEGELFESMKAYHQSDKFKFEARRCRTIQPVHVMDKAASDCSTSQTVIQSEYYVSEVHTVRVVFHIITDTNGVGDIPDGLINSQVDILNEDFGALSGTPGRLGYDSRIRFELAGITRTANRQWFADRRESQYKSALGWDRDLYLNIYTNKASGYLGYAYFPQDSAGTNLDGVVLNWTAVGRDAPNGGIYDQGRTATHEIGHYFGLYHTFQSGCDGSNPYTSGDRIADTNDETTARYDCDEVSSCGSPDPIHNYMDYTNDTCMTNFTQEQSNRMVCGMLNYRPLLYTTSTGGNQSPTADYSFVATDLDVTFTDLSTDPEGDIASWSWTFGDGGTSSAQNPSHLFPSADTYSVSLTVTDGDSASATSTQNVTVSDGGSGGFTATATGYKVKGRHAVDLSWSGASGTTVDIYRDGTFIAQTANNGAFTDNIGARGSATYVYQICESAGGGICSDTITVTF